MLNVQIRGRHPYTGKDVDVICWGAKRALQITPSRVLVVLKDSRELRIVGSISRTWNVREAPYC